MKIKTITCHDVYNVGASLQAYALATYLNSLGHETEIIDYKPDYLVHYKLTGVGNPKYDKPFLREAYQLAKLPGRIKERCSKRKKEFDEFTEEFLPLTGRRYTSNDELKQFPPDADCYIAGSDQIWNTFFQNGKDPVFYLDFAPAGKIRASYAASFATEDVADEWKEQIGEWLSRFDYISVREKSGVDIVKALAPDKDAVEVLDPVFLLGRDEWMKIEKDLNLTEPYILVYDFDRNPDVCDYVLKTAKSNGWKVYSILPLKYADRCFSKEGPRAFPYLVRNARLIVSNSFHATAFSLIFGKSFTVFYRNEKINTRMRDLLASVGLSKAVNGFCAESSAEVTKALESLIIASKEYLDQVLDSAK